MAVTGCRYFLVQDADKQSSSDAAETKQLLRRCQPKRVLLRGVSACSGNSACSSHFIRASYDWNRTREKGSEVLNGPGVKNDVNQPGHFSRTERNTYSKNQRQQGRRALEVGCLEQLKCETCDQTRDLFQ